MNKKESTISSIANKLRYVGYISMAKIMGNSFHTVPNVFVLCYHNISNDGWRFSIPFEKFKEQIEYLEKFCVFITPADLETIIKENKMPTKPSVLICFDDGYKEILMTRSYLFEKKIKPLLFVIGDNKNTDRIQLGTTAPLLEKNDILELYKDGWFIGNHSMTHSDFFSLDEKQIQLEIVDSKHKLEEELGIPVRYFAFPRGRYTDNILKTVKKSGYTLSFTMDDSFIDHNTDIYAVPRIGVDGTHTMNEFKYLFLRSSILMRKYIKKTFISKYL
jgi:peptidoglycan/xylan/chitin deacetylase (PgdA/CDA1 family)